MSYVYVERTYTYIARHMIIVRGKKKEVQKGAVQDMDWEQSSAAYAYDFRLALYSMQQDLLRQVFR
jgi:fructose 1,6-bisphosphatase